MLLDVSRLLVGAWRGQPSGMDRVEVAHARRALARPDARFVARPGYGPYGAVPADMVARVLDGGASRGLVRRAFLHALTHPARATPGETFLSVAHQWLDHPAPIARLKRDGARFVPYLIDLIPLLFPEYTRPPQTLAHARRLHTIATHADGLVVNAEAVARETHDWLRARGWRVPPILVAPLGLDLPAVAAPPAAAAPYFLCIATLEPRKNHLLLLQTWRELRAMQGDAAPRLVLVGRAGWEHEAVSRFLEREPGIAEWRGHCPDAELAALLAGARALLFPTFAEGFGIPLAEALAAAVPVLCADLPVLRELGGAAPDYLHPLDGPGWRDAVLDYTTDSPRRAAQIARISTWRAPGWDAHFAQVERFIEGLAPGPA